MTKWTIEDSRDLYNIRGWGSEYFDINSKGHIVIQPQNKHVRVSKDLYSSSDGDFKDRMKNLKKAYPNATNPELKEW